MTKRGIILLLAIGTVVAFTTVASADGTSPWPAGNNPKPPYSPINSFCDAYQAILDNGLLSMLPSEFYSLLQYLTPGVGDLNGLNSTLDLAADPVAYDIKGNGMLDCDAELRLVGDILSNTAFSLPAHGTYGGLTHAMVHAAWTANNTRYGQDVGSYWTAGTLGMLAPGLQPLLIGFMIVGDGSATFSNPKHPETPANPEYQYVETSGFAGFVQALLSFLADYITKGYISLDDYTRMPTYFADTGDADGDLCTNKQEYDVYGPCGGGTIAAYVSAALDPGQANCGGTGEGEGETTEFSPLITGRSWVEEGQSIILKVDERGGTPPYTYSWFKNSAPLSGKTLQTLTIANATSANDGLYYCNVTDQSKATKQTQIVPVTVFPAGSMPAANVTGLMVLLGALVAVGGFAIVLRRARSQA